MDLVQQLNTIYEGLLDFQKIENKAVDTKVKDINRMSKDIAELNLAIYTYEITGIIANDLRDKRNLLIDQLSNYIDIQYMEEPDDYGHSIMKIWVPGNTPQEDRTLVDHCWPSRPYPPDRTEVPGMPDAPGDVLGVRLVPNVLDGEEDVWQVYWRNDNEDELDFDFIKGGELKSHINMRDGLGGTVDSRDKGVPYYIEMMNNFARALVFEINTQHAQGWSDNPDGSRTGLRFFDILDEDGNLVEIGTVNYYDADGNLLPPPVDPDNPLIASAEYVLNDPNLLHSITARNITLSQEIQDSVYNIAAASKKIGDENDRTPLQLQRGNNENIREIYKIFQKTTITLPGKNPGDPDIQIGSLDEYATTVRFDVGVTLHTAKQAKETCRILTLAALNQKTAIAGVSLDEEMVGLVRYNHAYNGAARVITAMDDALDRLINGTGRVGL